MIKLGWMSVLSLLCLSSCSVDQYRNVQRKDRATCEKLDGKYIAGKYCFVRDAGVNDAAASDAAMADAMSGDAGPPDAGVDDTCPVEKEGKPGPCYTGKDLATSRQLPCHPGTHTCEGGHWGECTGSRTPEEEVCNGEDDDCDGTSDEGLNADLPSNACPIEGVEGVCHDGTKICISGESKCGQFNYPQTDICDGLDNDCDGMTDEDTDVGCYLGDSGCGQAMNGGFICEGKCQPGAIKCRNGSYDETMCEGQVTPEEEVCTPNGTDMLDENCDGQVDEGCSCNEGTPCYTGSPVSTQAHAPCKAGTQHCDTPTSGMCMNEVTPVAETCANLGVDDDCDGKVDNIPTIGTSCTAQSTGVGACKTGARWQCKNGDRVCVDALPSAERCDGQLADEDCDGKSDEGIRLDDSEDNCGACGVTCGAGLNCCARACVNTKTSNANCGACGKPCTGLNGCNNGGCALLGL